MKSVVNHSAPVYRSFLSHRFAIVVILLTAFLAAPASEVLLGNQPARAAETDEQRDARMKWWRDAKFGMFIHWGLYAIPAGEWKGRTNHAEWIRHSAQIPRETYDEFLDQFNPTEFDADAWARMAKDAGMKYLVITSKHHDGFCLWPSDLTDFDVESTPFKRDILGELSAACRKHGIKFCLYHSIMDWHHPDYLPRRRWEKERSTEGADYDRYVAYMKGQLKELIERYDPAVLWFDGEWEGTWTHERGKDLDDYVRSLKPDIIINNRVDKGRRGMEGLTGGDQYRGDFGTPEQQIPASGLPGVDWESCMTMNRHWGWNKNDKNWKSTADLIRKLVDIASEGGNFLLNIGPKPDGTFPQPSIERLAAIGRWMDVNGESIYGTTASPVGKVPWGRVTQKSDKLYLHVFDWPKDDSILLPSVTTKVKNAYPLAETSKKLDVSQGDQGVTVSLPDEALDPIDTVIVLELAEPVVVDRSIKPQADGTIVLPAQLATVEGSTARFESKSDRNCIGFWTNPKDAVVWEFKVKKPGSYTVQLAYACEPPGGSRVEVEAAKQKLEAGVKATDGWGDFQTMSPGGITFDQPGTYSLTVRPLELKGEGVMNLRSVSLRPGASE